MSPIVVSSLLVSLTSVMEFDIVVYGGTSAGVVAAVQAKRMKKSVVLIEPTMRLGGLSSGGLGQTDIGNKSAIGGISREFYERVFQHYQRPEAWKWQKRQEYRDGGQSRTAPDEKAMWTFEPSVARQIFEQMVAEEKIPVLFGQSLERKGGVQLEGKVIRAIQLMSGQVIRGKQFIDASYEGDLLAVSGVKYTVGREATQTYHETLNGVQTRQAIHHQFQRGVDPFLRRGERASGLLPGIDPTGPGKEGSADRRLQAYCYRMCLTDHLANRIPIEKPRGYDPVQYELLLRNFEAGEKRIPWSFAAMPNRKTDINNNTGFSTDFIGQNYDYPEADATQRAKILERHRQYQLGFLWALAHEPRVPASIRQEVGRWGLCKDEFAESNHWPAQIYVREARRMIGELVMTQAHCQGRQTVADPVGLAAYTMDSHHVQRWVTPEGHVLNEGDVQVGGFAPYSIGYGAIVPRPRECENLLVPVCLSASHIAYGSIRMEPVFMVLGQSAATAACLAVDEGVAVQQVNREKLQQRLLQDKQVLVWKGPRPKPRESVDAEKLPGIVVDDEQAERKGFDATSTSLGPHVGPGYRHDDDRAKGEQTARFTPVLPRAGMYEVRLAYTASNNRSPQVKVLIQHAEGVARLTVNQQKPPSVNRLFHPLGTFRFEAGNKGWVDITNADSRGHVILDAVQFVPRE